MSFYCVGFTTFLLYKNVLLWEPFSFNNSAIQNVFTHIGGALSGLLKPPAVGGPAIGGGAVVCDEEVVKEDVGGHGPELQPHGAERSHPERLKVLEERRVLDLPRLPHALEERNGGVTQKARTSRHRDGGGVAYKLTW